MAKPASILILGLLLSGIAAADVPDIQVTPQNVTEELAANQEHTVQFELYNNDSEYKVTNVSLQGSEYVDWQQNHFNISAEETRTVNATVYKKHEGKFNHSFQPEYYYPGADNSFDAPSINFNVSTYYRNTSVSLEAFGDSFDLDQLGDHASSVFRIDNTGGETGFNISIEDEGNVSFDQSDGFAVAQDESQIVSFNATVPMPEDNPTNATNKTYNYNISVSGENFQTQEFGIELFVPFKQYNETTAGQTIAEQWLELEQQRLEYCQSVESDSAVCDNEFTVVENNTEYVNQTPESNLTLTEDELEALKELADTTGVGYNQIIDRVKKLQNTIRYRQEKTAENMSAVAETQEKKIEQNREMIQGLNNTISRALDQEREEDRTRSFWGTIRFLLIALVVLTFGGWKYLKIREAKNSDTRV